MSFFDHHLFFCCNQRANGAACCQNHNASALRDYAKAKTAEILSQRREAQSRLKSPSAPQPIIRVNQAGCLGRCEKGPAVVIYPEGIWYTYRDKNDIDEIIDSHVFQGTIVERLLMEKPKTKP